MQPRDSVSTIHLLAACATERAGEAPWELLLERLAPRVRGAVIGALTLCGEPRDPDFIADLVQEVWCRLLERERRALAEFRGASERAAIVYLRRIAASVTIDALRAGAARKRRPVQLVPLDALGLEATLYVDRAVCPERRLLARERLRLFLALCRELVGPVAPRERLRIARLGLVEGRSSREIAERLGGAWTVPGIDSLLFRLRRQLEGRGIRLPRRPGGLAA